MQPGAAQPVENPIISAPLPEPARRRDPAIHEEVAPGDERAVGAHEQRADVPDFVRRAGSPGCRDFDHAPVARTTRASEFIIGQGDDDAWTDRVDPGAPRLPQRTASAITRNEFPRFDS